jgi:hypothetical protein
MSYLSQKTAWSFLDNDRRRLATKTVQLHLGSLLDKKFSPVILGAHETEGLRANLGRLDLGNRSFSL